MATLRVDMGTSVRSWGIWAKNRLSAAAAIAAQIKPLDEGRIGRVTRMEIGIRFPLFKQQFDVIVTTHKTIDLVFHTQVYKLKRDMTRQHTASAASVAFMHNDGMEVHDESPAHSPTADCGRPTPGGAPPQGAHDHSGTPGGQ
jgi:hypothetical protein